MDGPPSELNNWLRSWMKLRGPRNVTVSMLGCTDVLAPVLESKVNELKVIPMNEASLPKSTSSKLVSSPWTA